MTTTCSKGDYATRKGVSAAAITKAIKKGRVVVLPDGRVDVEASDLLWEHRTDPLQSARANAPKRRAAALALAEAGAAPESAPAGTAGALPAPLASVIYDLESARAKLQTHQANIAEMEERKLSGELCETAAVTRTLTTMVANFRMALERVPDKLADRLAAESDAHRCHQLISGEILQALEQLAKDCEQAASDIARRADSGR